ncbi:hypothetical protein [Bordetella holmesii]|uniref:hypothetical protein n=1 Tax=Bordetella holmesii TaxID=35814 RepID=UPI0010399C85|nr:hypothetical protein [Bordetella holmesii]MBO1240355.1 hypothetical protein [Bordetella holmesii]MBO1244068.1 hypothetical protein [Bordetella holmesii]MBO1247205.1 hypothetical protein [Bordetella holmesii]MBO1258853.1 hypothetical protein [Bordetella holmesii]MBO1262020.1 hypothetical protein [Bordetella holmesii]
MFSDVSLRPDIAARLGLLPFSWQRPRLPLVFLPWEAFVDTSTIHCRKALPPTPKTGDNATQIKSAQGKYRKAFDYMAISQDLSSCFAQMPQ